MMTRTAVLAAALAATALAGTAAADGNPAPAELKPVYAFVGTWKANVTMTMGGDAATLKATWTCKKVSAGWAVACKFVVPNMPGIGTYEENDLFGYDAASKTYHWYAVTNAGEVHDHAGHFDDQGNFAAELSTTVDGKKLREAITITMSGARSLALRSETFVDGQSQSVLAGTAKRK